MNFKNNMKQETQPAYTDMLELASNHLDSRDTNFCRLELIAVGSRNGFNAVFAGGDDDDGGGEWGLEGSKE
jgi:hypothetical protein